MSLHAPIVPESPVTLTSANTRRASVESPSGATRAGGAPVTTGPPSLQNVVARAIDDLPYRAPT